MALSPFTETDIIAQVYSQYENDNSTWDATSAEYLTSRNYTKAAILRWEFLEGVRWGELVQKLSAAADGTKTLTAATYTYGCPTDMRLPPQTTDNEMVYVRTLDSSGNSILWQVVPVVQISQLDGSTTRFCYFTGNQKVGFTLNLNPNINLTTGDTISYEYLKRATYLTTITSSTEMSNPMYIVHYCLHRLYKNDGQLSEASEELQIAESLLQEMKAEGTYIFETASFGFGTASFGFGT